MMNISGIGKTYFWAFDDRQGWNNTTYFSFFNDFGRSNMDLQYVEFGAILFLCLCSFVLNGLLIIFFLSKKVLRTEQHMYTLSIMLSTILLLPFAVTIGSTRLSADGWTYGGLACSTTLYFLVVTAFIKIWLMTLISVDRYLRIVHTHNRYIGRRLSIILLSAAWILPAGTLAGMVYPNSEAKYIPDAYDGITICTVAFKYHPVIRNAMAYFVSIFVIEFLLPTIIMIVCYTLIMKKIRKSTAALLKHNSQPKINLHTRTASKSLKCMLRRRRTTIILITILGLFLVMWTPLFLLLAIITVDQIYETFNMSSTIVVIQLCVLLVNTLIEPFLYSFTTSKVRNELRKTLRTIKPFKSKISSSTILDDTSTQNNSSMES